MINKDKLDPSVLAALESIDEDIRKHLTDEELIDLINEAEGQDEHTNI